MLRQSVKLGTFAERDTATLAAGVQDPEACCSQPSSLAALASHPATAKPPRTGAPGEGFVGVGESADESYPVNPFLKAASQPSQAVVSSQTNADIGISNMPGRSPTNPSPTAVSAQGPWEGGSAFTPVAPAVKPSLTRPRSMPDIHAQGWYQAAEPGPEQPTSIMHSIKCFAATDTPNRLDADNIQVFVRLQSNALRHMTFHSCYDFLQVMYVEARQAAWGEVASLSHEQLNIHRANNEHAHKLLSLCMCLCCC